MLFPFSLKGRALNWLELQPADSISTWEELVEKFQNKFFPLSRFSELKEHIGNFKQLEGESLCVGGRRFKELIKRCSQYVFSNGEKVRIFYKGVTSTYRVLLNAAAGGSIREITSTRAVELIEKMTFEDNEVTPMQPKRGVMQLEGYDAMLAKQDKIDQRLDSLVKLFTQNQISAVNSQFPVVCDTCGGPHSADKCEAMVTINPAQVNSLWYNQRRENNHYYNTYNTGWRNHSALSYNQGGSQQANMGIQPEQSSQKEAWEIAFEKMSQAQTSFVEETRTSLKNQEASIKNLEIHIGQLAKQMAERPPGTFPSNTIINPKEQCNAIITMKSVEKPIAAPSSEKDAEKENPAEEKADDPVDRDVSIFGGPLNDTPHKKVIKKLSLEERMKAVGDNPYVKAPYPQRLQHNEQKKNFSKFLEIFKKLHINIPFAEALEQMPSYAKFLKEILTKKRKLTVEGSTILTEECSAITQKNLPPKLKDPRSFSIPCTIGSMTIERVLCDLGASINVMPLSMMKKLGITEVKPINMILQLADRSTKQAYGVIEDILVKVDKFIFPMDFVILDIEEYATVPMIFGRPFLATSGVLIDVPKEEEKKDHKPDESCKLEVKMANLKSKGKHIKTKYRVLEAKHSRPYAREYYYGKAIFMIKGMTSSLNSGYKLP
ncbi:uncharacterized protein LOC133316540 [Gastrolobium bilobum]|uniref:uncharacterized protein LOC133316540 n=1 Tax=Gastrolobium bilobum TaxID=150636 RepID=UPI002AB11F34|nr:uncharacterized protein LOC133316540 [Gastrolobium bilobum]